MRCKVRLTTGPALPGLLLGLAAALMAAGGHAGDASQKPDAVLAVAESATLDTVRQGGAYADDLKDILTRIQLPPGFKIGLYALAPDARHMAIGPSTGMVFVGTHKNKVWVVTDRDHDHAADTVTKFAPSVRFNLPNGVCFDKAGTLYVMERNRVLSFPAAETSYESQDLEASTVVEQGNLVPADEESDTHGRRVCDIGPDDRLYISLGQPYNVPPPEKIDLYNELGIGGIIRMDRDGKNREVFARGIRNSVGLDFNPANGELWFTDNQVDGMGDDIPPGELNRATAAGQNFGFPWYGGGKIRTEAYKTSKPPADAVFPEVEEVAHAADLGMIFYTGRMFPPEYQGGIFSAQHGSWDRSRPVGARVMFTKLNADGSADESRPFAEGWLDESTEEYLGRPVDVAQLPDGSLLVSDDTAGAIYRIWYEQP